MVQVEEQEMQVDLANILNRVTAGETIIVCRAHEPIAEIRPLPRKPNEPRTLGLGKGQGTIHPSFFDPLPEELLDAFEGKPG